jgi:hypothetical protein
MAIIHTRNRPSPAGEAIDKSPDRGSAPRRETVYLCHHTTATHSKHAKDLWGVRDGAMLRYRSEARPHRMVNEPAESP